MNRTCDDGQLFYDLYASLLSFVNLEIDGVRHGDPELIYEGWEDEEPPVNSRRLKIRKSCCFGSSSESVRQSASL